MCIKYGHLVHDNMQNGTCHSWVIVLEGMPKLAINKIVAQCGCAVDLPLPDRVAHTPSTKLMALLLAFYNSTQSNNERTLQVTWHLNADSLHEGGVLFQDKLKAKTQATLPGHAPTKQLTQTGSNIAYCAAVH
jgi:hypothetical protein